MPIIASPMDTDQYILTMCQALLKEYPNTMAKFKFKCRNKELRFTGQQMGILNDEIDNLCSLRFSYRELQYLRCIRYFEPFFIEYLRMFSMNRDHIVCYNDKDGILQIETDGPTSSTCWFEVPVLRIVSAIDKMEYGEYNWMEGRERLNDKIQYVKNHVHRDQLRQFKVTDFGTRRANSPKWHEAVIIELIKNAREFFVGTSNMMFAMKYNLVPHGTMSHWWVQMHQQLGFNLLDSQKQAFKAWSDVYQGSLGIALSDTLGFNAFLKDFNLYFAKLFDGARHDSGDPYGWGHKLISHYVMLGIDPLSKMAIFSDGLTFELAVDLFKRFNRSIKTGFGIGTNLTNDLGPEPLQIVIKMTECNDKPVAKISDSKGKGMCEDQEYLSYLKRIFSITD